jgi:hypothetical protein
MSASEILRKHRFGAPPDATDHPSELLRKIHELSKPAPAPPGFRELSKFERDTFVEALTQIDAAGKKQKAAEQALADHLAGKVPGTPVSESLSYRGVITTRDAAGDFKTIDLTPSDANGKAYRIKVRSRDAASNLRSFDLIPVERARP